MTATTYAHFVASKKKPGEDIVQRMSPEQADALHMAVGVAGEGGELLDAVKRWAIYQKPLDRENIVEELGDLEFFMEGLRQTLGVTRDETLTHNVAKLSKRYEKGYTDAEAAARADKAEEPKPGTRAYAEQVHADMSDPARKEGETAEMAEARAAYYAGEDSDGLPSD